jgi:hypothetical protein
LHIDPTTLFLVWFGGGSVIFLAWAALVGQALMGERPGAVRPAIGILAAIGILHPAAAASAIDLARLGRQLGEPTSDDAVDPAVREARRARAQAVALPSSAEKAVYGCAAVSLVVAIAAFSQAGGLL